MRLPPLVVVPVIVICLAGSAAAGGQATSGDRLQALVKQLRDPDPARRGAALIALRDVRDPTIFPLLGSALVSAAEGQREIFIEALSLFPDPRKLPTLITVARRLPPRERDKLAALFDPLGAAAATALLDASADCSSKGWNSGGFAQWTASTAGGTGADGFAVVRAAAAHSDRYRRLAAVWALEAHVWQAPDEKASTASRSLLQRATADHDKDVSEEARAALDRIDSASRGREFGDPNDDSPLNEEARAELRSRDPNDRFSALERLREGSVVAGRQAGAALLNDPVENVRLAAAELLIDVARRSDRPNASRPGGTDFQFAVAALTAALRDRSAAVRAKAAEALGLTGELCTSADSAIRPETAALIRSLSDGSESVRATAAWALGLTRADAAVDALVALLRHPGASVGRAKAAAALGSISSARAGAALGDTLSDPDTAVRLAAARALDAIYYDPFRPRPDTLVGQMIAALRENDLRRSLVRPLGFPKNSRAVEPLVAALRGRPDLLEPACAALVAIGDSTAVGSLVPYLASADLRGRYTVARALGDLKDVAAVKPLAALLEDPSAAIRKTAAEGLGKIGDVSAVAALVRAATDADADTRNAIATSLGQLGDRSAIPALLRVLPLTPAAASVLGTMKERSAVPGLIEMLQGNGPQRDRAARALGLIAAPRAVPALIAALRDERDAVGSDELQSAAAWALGEIGGSDATSALEARYREVLATRGNSGLSAEIEAALRKLGRPVPKR